MRDGLEVGVVACARNGDPGCCRAAFGGGGCELGVHSGEVCFRRVQFIVEARCGRDELSLAPREALGAGVELSERRKGGMAARRAESSYATLAAIASSAPESSEPGNNSCQASMRPSALEGPPELLRGSDAGRRVWRGRVSPGRAAGLLRGAALSFAFGADGDVADRGGPRSRAVAPRASNADGEVGDEPAAAGPRVTARARRLRGPPVGAGGNGSVGMPRCRLRGSKGGGMAGGGTEPW